MLPPPLDYIANALALPNTQLGIFLIGFVFRLLPMRWVVLDLLMLSPVLLVYELMDLYHGFGQVDEVGFYGIVERIY